MLPEIPAEGDIHELAKFFAKHEDTINAYRSAIYRMQIRLKDHYASVGPIQTDSGTITLIPNGYDYDADRIAEIMPGLISNAEVTFRGKVAEVERVLSLVTEEMPSVDFEVKRTVDKTEVARVLRMKGDGAVQLESCRTPKGKIGVNR